MNNCIFYWESLHSTFCFNPKINYVLYYKGCFCPPHIGHFSQAAIPLQNPNVKVIIHQKGGQSRHGVPKEANRQLWKYYIKKLLPTERVDLVQYTSKHSNNYLLLNHPWIKSADVLLILHGDEFPNKREKEKSTLKKWSPTLSKLSPQVVFYYTTRDHSKISATTFINKLIAYKTNPSILPQLYTYLPPLTKHQKLKIIKLLLTYNLF